MILTVFPSDASAFAFSRARRTIAVLNAPHTPRSPVQTTSRCVWLEPLPTRSRGPCPSVAAPARFVSTDSTRSAYGRAASTALCARRSFETATICIALVIFCVDLTEAIRFLRSFRDGIADHLRARPFQAKREAGLGVGSFRRNWSR